ASVAGWARLAAAFNKRVSAHLGHRSSHLEILRQTRANIKRAEPSSGATTASGGTALGLLRALTARAHKIRRGLMFFRNKDDETPIGHYFSLKLIKNFTDKKQYKIQIPILYGKGVWLEKEIFDLAVSYSLVSRSGAWYTVEEELQNLGLPE